MLSLHSFFFCTKETGKSQCSISTKSQPKTHHLSLSLETGNLVLTYLSSSYFPPKDNKNYINSLGWKKKKGEKEKKGSKTSYLDHKKQNRFIKLKFHIVFSHLKCDQWQHKNKHWGTFIRNCFIRKENHHLYQHFSVHRSRGVTDSKGQLSACSDENVCIFHHTSLYCSVLLLFKEAPKSKSKTYTGKLPLVRRPFDEKDLFTVSGGCLCYSRILIKLFLIYRGWNRIQPTMNYSLPELGYDAWTNSSEMPSSTAGQTML